MTLRGGGVVKDIFMVSGDVKRLESCGLGSFRVCPVCVQGHVVAHHDSPACVAQAECLPLLSICPRPLATNPHGGPGREPPYT